VSPGEVLGSTAALLEAKLADAQASGRLPSLTAAVVRSGELAWWGTRGRFVSRDGDRRADPDTQYRIGSITKTMTAVLVLQLRDEGRLDLAEPLSAHLPEVAYGDRSIRALLAHNAGLPAEPPGPWWERSPGQDWEALQSGIADSRGVLPPGRQYHYSNLAFALLGQLVAKLHGRPWRDALRDRLLDPLGLDRTTYRPQPPAAQGFSVRPFAHTLTDEPARDTDAMAPAGQLWSSARDLARWAAFLAAPDPRVLAPETLAEMAIVQSADPRSQLVDAYGLGLRLLRRGEGTLVGHTGSMPGFLAAVFVDPGTRVGAVALANGTRGLDAAGFPADLITTVLAHEPAVTPEWEPAEDSGHLAELLGRWYWGNTPFDLCWQGGALLLSAPGSDEPTRFAPGPAGDLVGLDDYFSGETMRVVRRRDGAVSHLDLATFVLTRTPYDPQAPIPGGAPPAQLA
jgi:CubicO group peptidase (beta-lactamase class C family)